MTITKGVYKKIIKVVFRRGSDLFLIVGYVHFWNYIKKYFEPRVPPSFQIELECTRFSNLCFSYSFKATDLLDTGEIAKSLISMFGGLALSCKFI